MEYDVFYVDHGDREWLKKSHVHKSWPDILTVSNTYLLRRIISTLPLFIMQEKRLVLNVKSPYKL